MNGTVRYRTIVADPPWRYDSWPIGRPPKAAIREVGRRTPIAYPTMTVAEISALPVDDMAAKNAHLYLWTTSRYLRDAFDVIDAWGFRYSQTLTWAKTPMGIGPGGAFASNTEFILVARRGSLRNLIRVDSAWFNWKRQVVRDGGGGHSRKPDAFLDLVETVSPGPYLEMFARRNRLGWDTWGDEAMNHVEMGEPVDHRELLDTYNQEAPT